MDGTRDDIIRAVNRQVRRPNVLSYDQFRGIHDIVEKAGEGTTLPTGPYDVVADLAVRLDIASDCIRRLPKTADGWPIIPGDVVYWVSASPSTLDGITVILIMDGIAFYRCGDEELIVPTDVAYRTREAALAMYSDAV